MITECPASVARESMPLEWDWDTLMEEFLPHLVFALRASFRGATTSEIEAVVMGVIFETLAQPVYAKDPERYLAARAYRVCRMQRPEYLQ